MLSQSFLSPYHEKGDNFPNLLSRVIYLSKYKRPEDSCWTDTIRRVVEGNCALDPQVTQDEAQKLFDMFWHMYSLPAGRGLWSGGVPNLPGEAAFNCYYITLRGLSDFSWIINNLMLGGGVGVGVHNASLIGQIKDGPDAPLRLVSTKYREFASDEPTPQGLHYYVPDTREGWAEGFKHMAQCALQNAPCNIYLDAIRPKGAPIRTFGGVASGPAPYAELLRASWDIFRGAKGRSLRPLEALDIVTHIGKCVKAGNVRRSSIMVLFSAEDDAVRAKQDLEKLYSHRHTSNNSINFYSREQFDAFDWKTFVELNVSYGDPGINNLWLGRKQDPFVEGLNPCGEVQLQSRESCNLVEVFPGLAPRPELVSEYLRLATRYCLRQRLIPFQDEQTELVKRSTMRLGVALGGLCDFAWNGDMLESYYHTVRNTADSYAKDLGVRLPIATTTVKPSGTISLLNGSSPGIHAPESDYYWRRIRLDSCEPMAEELKHAGIAWEKDVYDKTGNTLVFAFPMKAPKVGGVTSQNQTVRDQFQRQLAVQQSWTDNAISCTIRFRPEDSSEVEACLREYAHQLKSVSMLSTGSVYEQMPYEPIDRETYEKAASLIHPTARLTPGEADVQECEKGACPIR